MDGISSTHLGTRFWITSDAEGIKTLGLSEADSINENTRLNFTKITAKSERINSLAQDGISGRFADTFNAAKAFGKRVEDINNGEFKNLDFLKFCFEHINRNPFDKHLDDLAKKVGAIEGAKGDEETIKTVIKLMCGTRDFNDFVAAHRTRDGFYIDGFDWCDNFIASLINASAGAMKLINEGKATPGSILELDKNRLYDLSRRYDMYEIAVKTLKKINDEPNGVRFDRPLITLDAGDGSSATLKNKLLEIKAEIKEKLAFIEQVGGVSNNVKTILKDTAQAIRYCLNRGFKVRNEDKFYAKAQEVLKPLMDKAGSREVNFTTRISGAAGVLDKTLKAEVGVSGNHKTKVEKTNDGFKLTIEWGGGIDASAAAKLGYAPGDETGPEAGSIAKGLNAKVSGKTGFVHQSSKTFATLEDLIAHLANEHEIVGTEVVSAGKKSLGILGSIGRAFRGAWRKFWNWKTNASEIDTRKYFASLKEYKVFEKCDNVISRREQGLVISKRNSIILNGNVGGQLSGNVGISRGEDEKGKADDYGLFNGSLSGSISGTRDMSVEAVTYRSIASDVALLPDEDLKGYLPEELKTIDFDNLSQAEIENRLKGLSEKLIEAEDVAALKEEGWEENFVEAWYGLAAEGELLMRKLEDSERNLGIKESITDRINHPRLHDAKDVLEQLNRIADINAAGRKTKSFQLDFTYDILSGDVKYVNDIANKNDGLAKTVFAEGVKTVSNTIKAGASAAFSPKGHFGVSATVSRPISKKPAPLPWNGLETITMALKFTPSMSLGYLAENIFDAYHQLSSNDDGNISAERRAAAKEKFKSEVFNTLGIAVNESIIGTSVAKLLEDKALSPKASAAFTISNEGSITLTFDNGRLVSLNQTKSETTTSSIGGEVTVPIFGADVAIGLKCSQEVTETVSTRFCVGEMPIDSVLGRANQYSGVSCREKLVGFFVKNLAAAKTLIKEVKSSIKLADDEFLTARVALCKERKEAVENTLAKFTDNRRIVYLASRFQKAKEKLESVELGEGNPTDVQLKALADYLETMMLVFNERKGMKA